MRLDRKLERPRKRPGYTLIEMVVLMTATSAMLALLTGWIHQSLKQASHFRNVQRDQITLTRLSDDVRRTVWRSKSASVTSPVLMDFLMADGNEVRYQVEGQSIQRVERDALGKPVRTDRFRFANRHRVVWGRDGRQDTNVDEVTLQVNRLPANQLSNLSPSANTAPDEGIVALHQTAGVARWTLSAESAEGGTP